MVDEVDEKILSLLEENARMTYVELGNIIGLSEGAELALYSHYHFR